MHQAKSLAGRGNAGWARRVCYAKKTGEKKADLTVGFESSGLITWTRNQQVLLLQEQQQPVQRSRQARSLQER